MNSATNFFLGSNTNEGFYSCFDELYNPEEDGHIYILKGGAGCGKSTLMKKVSQEIINQGLSCECVKCASDPNSFDAVICREKNIVMVDGTAPHVVEPKYYGAVEEIVNLGEALDTEGLHKEAGKLRELCDRNAMCYKKATNYLRAAASLSRNSKRIQDEYINYEKLYNYVVRFTKRNFRDGGGDGRVSYRFYSAITPDGEVTFSDGIKADYEQIIGIEDSIGCVSGQILDCLLTVAVDYGINAVAGISPYDTDEIRELLFPEQKLAIVRKRDDIPVTRIVHAARFLNAEGMRAHRHRLVFNKKTASQLCTAAVSNLHDAKGIHDEMEKLYAANIDYTVTERITNEVLERITTVLQNNIAKN